MRSAIAVPTGLHHEARGCEARATPGSSAARTYLDEVADGVLPQHPRILLFRNAFGVGMRDAVSRGSSFLATPGSDTESLGDIGTDPSQQR
jgi:hypothetical protein